MTRSIKAEKKIRDKTIRLMLNLRKDNPEHMELYDWLRSIVEEKKQVPSKVIELLLEIKNESTKN